MSDFLSQMKITDNSWSLASLQPVRGTAAAADAAAKQ